MIEYWLAWAVIALLAVALLLRGERVSGRIRKVRRRCPTCGLPYDTDPTRAVRVCRCTAPLGGTR
jgi:hypothetical protein